MSTKKANTDTVLSKYLYGEVQDGGDLTPTAKMQTDDILLFDSQEDWESAAGRPVGSGNKNLEKTVDSEATDYMREYMREYRSENGSGYVPKGRKKRVGN